MRAMGVLSFLNEEIKKPETFFLLREKTCLRLVLKWDYF